MVVCWLTNQHLIQVKLNNIIVGSRQRLGRIDHDADIKKR